MRRRIDKRFLPAASPDAPAVAVDEKAELEQVNVLYSLLENRYSRKVPVSPDLAYQGNNG